MAATPDLAITFAGGGNRAFYQLGLMQRWYPTLEHRLVAISAVSAGACVITLLLAGRAEAAYTFWERRRAGVTKNIEWAKLLRGERPAPHAAVYRETLLHALDEGGFDRVRERPYPILVLAAAFPRLVPSGVAVAAGLAAYSIEKAARKRTVHPAFGRAIGFSPVVVDARACATPEELADLIIASSATPPFTPVGRFRGRALLDGGMVDNVPAFVADALPGVSRNLVLLTRPYPAASVGRKGSRLYVAPAAPVPVSRWDYTRPDLVQATIALGERDADRFRPALDAFLDGPDSGASRRGDA
jgi:predicted acylesterase/phospholipase RssA